MWAKITQALKARPDHLSNDHPNTHNDVMSKVYEQHPNLSVFHSSDDVPFPIPSPPSSPSKHGRRSMFKRKSKVPPNGEDESVRAASPMLPIGMPRKIKATLNPNSSQISLARASSDTTRPLEDHPRQSHETSHSSFNILRRASQDLIRASSQDMLRQKESARPIHNTSTPSQGSAPFTSRDIPQDKSYAQLTPFDMKSSSVRSILRDPNTPGTGQNVRFFSRDAYMVISPDASMATDAEPDTGKSGDKELAFMDRLQQASSTPVAKTAGRPSVTDVFSHVDQSKELERVEDLSVASPVQPTAPDISKFFDLSGSHDLPPIPVGFDVPLLDTAIEMSEAVVENTNTDVPPMNHTDLTSTPHKPKVNRSPPPTLNPTPPIDRNESYSLGGQTIFYSMANSSPTGSDISKTSSLPADLRSTKNTRPATAPSGQIQPKNRNRALSDTVFQTMIRSTGHSPPEAEINDESTSQLVVYSSATPEPDPFRANATTYYTPQTMIPATPPREASKHTKKTSREEDLIVTLRTQLALQSELCTQYEVDLRARDELVEMLGKRVDVAEREVEKRRNVLKGWKKKVVELERACRHLEEEVDHSRQESMERSIMDEASGEALRMLHRQIAGLEREKKDAEKREDDLREEVGTLEALVKEKTDDVQRLNETLWNRDEDEQALKLGMREHMEIMGHVGEEGEAKALGVKLEETNNEHVAELAWDTERTELGMQLSQLQNEKKELEMRLDGVCKLLTSREDELGVLKNELEAQWKRTETASGETEQLERERDALQQERAALQADVKAFEERIGGLEVEWTESENKRNELEGQAQELWAAREALEKERDELAEQLRSEREQVDNLTPALQEREDRVVALDQERKFALENVDRLEEKVRQRDAELAACAQRIVQREVDAEQLREEMSNMKRQHARVLGEQIRALQETAGQEGEARKHMEALVKDKAEADVEMGVLKERVSALKDEVDRLRRQVHSLQQESADKEVKIVQIAKQRAQDKEDLNGLNIALDSKQQELELLKRRMGLKGTAGSTPAQTSKIAHRPTMSTPGMSRPPSVVSDSGSVKDRKLTDTPATKTPALGKSIRVNTAGNQSSTGSMGPPASKPRPSMMGTPTPTSRALSRSSSTRPMQPSTPIPQRSVSSNMDHQTRMKISRQAVNASPTPSCPESDGKENVDTTRSDTRRRNLIPVPA